MQHFLCGGFCVRFGKPFRSGTSNFDELENRKNTQTQSFFFDAHPQNILRCMICSKTKGSPVEKPSANGVLTSPQKEEQKRNVREEKRKDRNNFWKTSIFERKTECGKEGKMKRKHVKSLDKKRKKKERSEKLRLVKMNHTNTICCRPSLFGNQCHWGCCAFQNKESFLLFGVYGGAIFIFESVVLTPNLWNGSKWVCAQGCLVNGLG